MNARRLALSALVAAQLAASAAADNLSWTFQRTGFRSTLGSSPQTALSMRSNLSWPVVYGFDESMLNAYSLFPVANTGNVPIGPPTNWHKIGTSLTKSFLPSGNLYMQADSGAPDGFAVSLQSSSTITPSQDVVVIGDSLGGFQPPLTGMQAVKFNNAGNPFVASTASIPAVQQGHKLFDVALSNFGEVGAVTQSSSGAGGVTFWQQSPLLGGAWRSQNVVLDPRTEQTLMYGPSMDLAYDAASRPHIVGINRPTSNNAVNAVHFDIVRGLWTTSVLDTAASGLPPIADVAAAASDDGLVGAAWVNNGVLKYAYLDANDPTPSWVVTTVASGTPTGTLLENSQGVGLAFDRAGLPVISFVERSNRQIWIAYDPPVALAPHAGPTDFNGDGFVDGGDLQDWTAGFGEGPAADADGDDNSDGSDFLAWQQNLSAATASAATAAVPEPASLSIVLMAACALVAAPRCYTARSERHT